MYQFIKFWIYVFLNFTLTFKLITMFIIYNDFFVILGIISMLFFDNSFYLNLHIFVCVFFYICKIKSKIYNIKSILNSFFPMQILTCAM